MRRPGFTLIEVMLVVVVLAVALGVAVPNLSVSWQNFGVQKAADDLAYLMRYAQDRAVRADKQLRMNFVVQARSYALTEESIDDRDPSAEKKFQPVAGRWGKLVVLPEAINMEPTQNSVDFSADGRMSRVRVVLCRQQNCLTVSTQEQSGMVDVLKGRVE